MAFTRLFLFCKYFMGHYGDIHGAVMFVRSRYIGPNSSRGLDNSSALVQEVIENHVETEVFTFLVGIKLLALFLLVVHHMGMYVPYLCDL